MKIFKLDMKTFQSFLERTGQFKFSKFIKFSKNFFCYFFFVHSEFYGHIVYVLKVLELKAKYEENY